MQVFYRGDIGIMIAMHKKQSVKLQIARRVAVYTIMSVSVVLLVIALVFVMLGYQFNRQDGRIEQGGLVQFNSQPTGARVTIDGVQTSLSTADKSTLSQGKHTIEYSRDGYQTWKKDVTVTPSSVLWLTYARLVPTQLETKPVATLDGLASSLTSPNKRYIAALQHADRGDITLFRLDGDTPKSTKLTLPATSFTQPTEGEPHHNFTLESWDANNRFVLVNHKYGTDGQEWIVVDTDNVERSRNVTTLVGVQMTKPQFSVGDNHILYAIVDGSLRKINLNDATISRPLVPYVADFRQYDRATLVYETAINPETKQRSVGYYTDNARNARTVREYADDGTDQLRFRLVEYYGERFYAIQYGDAIEVFKGDVPSSDSTAAVNYTPVTSLSVPSGVDQLNFSENSRFLVAQKDAGFLTYDLELKQLSRTTLAGTGEVAKLRWMDSFTLVSDRGGVLRSYEFDGLNPREYGSVTAGQAFALSPNEKYLYSFGVNAESQPVLQRVNLRV